MKEIVKLAVGLRAINQIVGGAGRSERSVCIDRQYGVEGWPQIRGFLSTILYGNAVGTMQGEWPL